MRKIILIAFILIGLNAVSQTFPWNDQIISPIAYTGTPAITGGNGGSDMLLNGSDQVFYIGTDQLVHNYWRDANSNWVENPLCPTAQPAIANSGLVMDNQACIYYVGTDGYIYRMAWSTTTSLWSANKLSVFTSGTFMAARADSRLGIYNTGTNTCRIFYVATDNFLHFVELTLSGWITGILSSNPQVVRQPSNFLVDASGRIFYVRSDLQVSNAYPNGPMYVEFPLSLTGSPARPFTGISSDPSGSLYYVATDSHIHCATWAPGPGWSDVALNPPSSLTVKPGASFTLNNGQLMYTSGTGQNCVIYNNGTSFAQLSVPSTTSLLKSSWGTANGLAYYFDASGKLHQLTPNLTTSNITTSGILHEKFEIGVVLPANIDTDINNFCNNVPTNLYPPGAKNPYDPDQIKVKATYTDPSNKKYVRFGFFYREVNIVDAYDYNISAALSTYPFRIRIAPEATGTWTVNVELYINNVLSNSTTGTFSVASSSHRGPLTLLPGKYFKDFNGNDFFIVGQNADITPPKQAATPHNEYDPASAIPASFTTQRNAITDLASKNANFIRWRITPWTYELEGAYPYTQNLPFRTLEKNLNNYDTRQHYAWEMDQTVTTLEQNNMYSMLTLFYDPFWIHTDKDWWGNAEVKEQSHYEYNPYSTYDLPLTSTTSPQRSFTDCSSSHPNVINSINSFFNANTTNTARFRNIQKKLFYIMARWGYSPNIAVWQIDNEADNTGNVANNPNVLSNLNSMYNTDSPTGFRATLETWTSNVNTYLQTFYPRKWSMNGYGTTGNGFSWAPLPNPSSQGASQDICSFNTYPDNIWDYRDEFQNQAVYKNNPVNRPFLSSEHGFSLSNFGLDWCTEYESHKKVWSGTFTGALGTPLLFWDQYQDNSIDHRTKFTHIADLMSSLNSIAPNYLNAVYWAPGYSNVTGAPHFETGYGNNSVKRETNFYLRSSDQNTVIGWLNNYGYNWWSLRLANRLNDDPQVSPTCKSDPTSTVTLSNFTPDASYLSSSYGFGEDGLYNIFSTSNFTSSSLEPWATVTGLKATANYLLEPYDAYNGGYIPALNQSITTDAAGNVNFSLALNNGIDKINKQYPDYAYRLTWINPINPHRFASTSGTSHAAIAPNPTTGAVTVTEASGLISSIEAYDLMGKFLFKIQDVNEKTKTLDLSLWKGEVIILKIKDVTGNCTVHRCIVMAD